MFFPLRVNFKQGGGALVAGCQQTVLAQNTAFEGTWEQNLNITRE